MPLAVYVLGMSVFSLGTSEFMLAGILQPIARDLGVSIPRAGLLISAFAIGMVLGAPLLAAATLRLPRRATLLTFLFVFVLGQVAGALAPTYEVLLAHVSSVHWRVRVPGLSAQPWRCRSSRTASRRVPWP